MTVLYKTSPSCFHMNMQYGDYYALYLYPINEDVQEMLDCQVAYSLNDTEIIIDFQKIPKQMQNKISDILGEQPHPLQRWIYKLYFQNREYAELFRNQLKIDFSDGPRDLSSYIFKQGCYLEYSSEFIKIQTEDDLPLLAMSEVVPIPYFFLLCENQKQQVVYYWETMKYLNRLKSDLFHARIDQNGVIHMLPSFVPSTSGFCNYLEEQKITINRHLSLFRTMPLYKILAVLYRQSDLHDFIMPTETGFAAKKILQAYSDYIKLNTK